MGVRGGYTLIPDFIMSAIMSKFQSTSGGYVDVFGTRQWRSVALHFGTSFTRFGAPTGIWQRNPQKIPNLVVVSANFLAFEAMADWEIRAHRKVAFHGGIGAGIGFAFGTIESDEVDNAGRVIPGTHRNRLQEDGWPIYPVLRWVLGWRFDLADHAVLRLDFDFRNTFGFALGFTYEI